MSNPTAWHMHQVLTHTNQGRRALAEGCVLCTTLTELNVEASYDSETDAATLTISNRTTGQSMRYKARSLDEMVISQMPVFGAFEDGAWLICLIE